MEFRRLKTFFALWLAGCALTAAQQAPIPAADELNGRPFAIRQTWVIGGTGNWDYLTMDAASRQLYIAHQDAVQVLDVTSGRVAGQLVGLTDAHAVILDPDGQTGYVSDGRDGVIQVFDRRSYAITAEIQVPGSPRALVLEPETGLLFAFGAQPTAEERPENRGNGLDFPIESNPCTVRQNRPSRTWPAAVQSVISLIDPAKQARVADIRVCGELGEAQADGAGQVYFTIANLGQVGRLDAEAILKLRGESQSEERKTLNAGLSSDGTLLLDLREATAAPSSGIFPSVISEQLELYGLGPECEGARALALDPAHSRLFAGCTNQRLQVLNTGTGQPVQALTIGPGVDVMAYDASRGLLFTANGGGYGSVSIIRRHITDTYSVIQNLATLEQARTLCVDPSNGDVYLVTTLYGAKLENPPMNGVGTLKLNPVEGSFRVLVIGN